MKDILLTPADTLLTLEDILLTLEDILVVGVESVLVAMGVGLAFSFAVFFRWFGRSNRL